MEVSYPPSALPQSLSTDHYNSLAMDTDPMDVDMAIDLGPLDEEAEVVQTVSTFT